MKNMTTTQKKRIGLTVLAVIASVSLGLVLFGHSGDVQEKPSAIKPVRTITVASQEGGDIIMQAGEIAPAHAAELSFQVGGKLIKRHVEVGSTVTAGQTLAIVDSTELNNELRVAAAELESAKATSKLAQENAARAARLLASQAIAKAQVDAAATEARAAEEKRKAAEAAYENAKRRVEHATLKAPEAGIVTAVTANAGEVVSAGQTVIKLAQGNGVDAVFDVSEKVFNAAPTDIKVRVSLISDPKVMVDGVVREVSPAADPTTRTYRVKIALNNAPQTMAYGASVMGKATLPAASVIKIPSSALTSENDQPAVYVVDETSNQLLRVPVTVQNYTEESAYISKGLSGGQRVVIAGVSKLRPGQAVTLEGGNNE